MNVFIKQKLEAQTVVSVKIKLAAGELKRK